MFGICVLAVGAFLAVVGIRILKLPDILIVTNDTEILLVKQSTAIKFSDIDSIIAIADSWQYGSYRYGTIVFTTKSGVVYRQGDIEKVVATANELNMTLKERLIILSDI